MGVALSLAVERWDGPFDAGTQQTVLDALEAGQVLVLPQLAFALQPEEHGLLDAGALDGSRKNISFDPARQRVHGTGADAARQAQLSAMLDRFAHAAETLMQALLPRYVPSLERARASFRPAEIAGRTYALRKDDRRLHVDAFPSRPMQGRRILRLFTNVAMDGTPRRWRVGEPFPDFAAKFLPRVRPPLPGQGWAMARLGLTKGQRERYDFIMLGLHDAAKLDDEYQAQAPAHDIEFPPGCTWLCFTDSVLHAALGGHCALEQTFHIPVSAMVRPEHAPLHVLQKLSRRPLARA